MFECERCGSSYSATHLGVEHCPRCQLRDRVEAPLAFKAFQRTGARASEVDPAVEAAADPGLGSPLPAPAEAS